MISYVLPLLLKYWKASAISLVLLALSGSIYLAHRRGEALAEMRRELAQQETRYRLNLKLLGEVRQAERERDDFRKMQTQTLKDVSHETLILSPDLHTAYERLRQRQSGHAAR